MSLHDSSRASAACRSSASTAGPGPGACGGRPGSRWRPPPPRPITGANRLAIGTATTLSRSTESPRRLCGDRRGCGGPFVVVAGRPRTAEQFGLQAAGELGDQVAGDVGEHAAAELGRLTRDRQVGGDDDVGGVALVLELRGDGRRGGAVAPGLLALGLEHDPLGRRVLLLVGRNALVGHRDRADLDLHRAGELVAVDRQQRGAGKARGHPFDVGEHLPDLRGAVPRPGIRCSVPRQWSFPALLDEFDDRGRRGGQLGHA